MAILLESAMKKRKISDFALSTKGEKWVQIGGYVDFKRKGPKKA